MDGQRGCHGKIRVRPDLPFRFLLLPFISVIARVAATAARRVVAAVRDILVLHGSTRALVRSASRRVNLATAGTQEYRAKLCLLLHLSHLEGGGVGGAVVELRAFSTGAAALPYH